MSKFEQYFEQYTAVKPSREEMQHKVHDVIHSIFEANPEINSITVKGFTPGFNDGDPCYHHQFTAVGGMYGEYFSDAFNDDGNPPTIEIEEDISDFIVDPMLQDGDIPEGTRKAYTLVSSMQDDIEKAFSTNKICAWLRNPKDSSEVKFFTNYAEPVW